MNEKSNKITTGSAVAVRFDSLPNLRQNLVELRSLTTDREVVEKMKTKIESYLHIIRMIRKMVRIRDISAVDGEKVPWEGHVNRF